MDLDEALKPVRRLLIEDGADGVRDAAVAVSAARAALVGGADAPTLWELAVLPEWDHLEARRLLAAVAEELGPALRLPVSSQECEWAQARYALEDLLAGRLSPEGAAWRIHCLLIAYDPGSPLWPIGAFVHHAEERQYVSDARYAELVAELHELARGVLAEPADPADLADRG
ncbi:hypothetical protein AB0K51_04650 [Kitasatospora sp. NPDC049285]|uniref:hypothetical protein n=1 Tax=Kitasatospora sp. NPDC049285 TaxID=3157096 RepID=UPI003425D171